MGKKLFFLSLIVLSIAMGAKWQKNRPKIRPTTQAQTRVAIRHEDLQLQEQSDSQPNDNDTTEGDESPESNSENEEQNDKQGDGEKNADPQTSPADDLETTAAETILSTEDPIILALQQMKRNPFERSPYAKLVEDLQKKEEIAAKPVEKKSVKLLAANFTATIETRKELVAVIDSRLYRKGELFQDKKISEIKAELVSLESGPDTFLIPKSGVNVNIAEDGTYTVVDNFHKN